MPNTFKLTLILDQTDPDADTLPDGLMKNYADEAIAEFNDMGNITRTIGNEDIIMFFRLAVKEQRLSPDDIILIVNNGNRITFDKNGNLDGRYDVDQSWSEAGMKLF